jgi:uncharacterized YigZ family protein
VTSYFKSVKKSSEALFKEKSSKFYGFVFPIQTEDEFKTKLESIKSLHPQAGHFCYAFRIGISGESYRYSDDGEPNNSAGKPIYGQLLSYEITNVGAIVVRYFGGTKLGVGGLVSAYKETAKQAIEVNELVETELKEKYSIEYNYDETTKFNQLVSKFDLEILDTKFEVNCKSMILCNLPQKDDFENYCNEFQIEYTTLKS